ncbi:hypothetical protein KM043_004593 [Ampulex compressa]|nr:hypothetical protein KM043_004593 [Ampulex compressa]
MPKTRNNASAAGPAMCKRTLIHGTGNYPRYIVLSIMDNADAFSAWPIGVGTLPDICDADYVFAEYGAGPDALTLMKYTPDVNGNLSRREKIIDKASGALNASRVWPRRVTELHLGPCRPIVLEIIAV